MTFGLVSIRVGDRAHQHPATSRRRRRHTPRTAPVNDQGRARARRGKAPLQALDRHTASVRSPDSSRLPRSSRAGLRSHRRGDDAGVICGSSASREVVGTRGLRRLTPRPKCRARTAARLARGNARATMRTGTGFISMALRGRNFFLSLKRIDEDASPTRPVSGGRRELRSAPRLRSWTPTSRPRCGVRQRGREADEETTTTTPDNPDPRVGGTRSGSRGPHACRGRPHACGRLRHGAARIDGLS